VLQDIDLNEEIDYGQFEDANEGNSNSVVIVKMRTLIKKIRKSTKLRQKLNKLCIMYEVKYLVPIIDVKTRWNSTYNMIIRSKHLQTPLKHLCVVEKKLVDLQITSRDWYELEKIQKLLAKFDRATKLVSMARHPTISAYLPTLDWLLEYLRKYVAENSGCVANAVKEAVIKLEKYELDIAVSVIPFVGTFLNPALKKPQKK